MMTLIIPMRTSQLLLAAITFLLLTVQPLRADARVTEAFDDGWRFLKAVARNERKAVATDELRPAGAPAKIVLATTPKKARDVLGRPRHCHPRG